MLSKNQIKRITALKQKKTRNELKMFIAEGKKVIQELVNARFKIVEIYVTNSSISFSKGILPTLISEAELKKISCLTTPNDCLAIFEFPGAVKPKENGLILVLDAIRDPGNLGTIIRLADWFGVEQIICSEDTAEVFNPKVIQASMGSISRVNIIYANISEYLISIQLPIYGAFIDGENVYHHQLPENAVLVIGNEANGISELIEEFVQKRISIPRFGKLQLTESLNAATATAILLSEFKRGINEK
jgi:TrmH family RNA methyltransferase